MFTGFGLRASSFFRHSSFVIRHPTIQFWTLDSGLWTQFPVTLLLRILYRLYRILSSLRYWALRRFTQAGPGVLAALLAAAMLGLDTDNNVAYQAFTLLLF